MGDELFGWLCLGPVAALCLVQFLGGLYCLYMLDQKSPLLFLWSIDWALVLIRVEREFGITFCPDDFRHLISPRPPDITAGELFAIVRRKVWDAGYPAPADSWPRLAEALGEALNVSPSSILCESRLRADLGME